MKEMKRVLAMVLCLVMLVGVLPVNAFAAPGDKKPGEDPAVVETTEATVAETTEATEPAKPELKGPAADKKDEAPKGPVADKENKPGKENKPEKPGKPGKEEQVETSEPTVPETTEATVPETTEETVPETTEETVPEELEVGTFDLRGDSKYPVDALAIFTDLHIHKNLDKKAELQGVMGALAETGLPFSGVFSAGDNYSVNGDNDGTNNLGYECGKFTGYTGTLTSYIQEKLPGVTTDYLWSDHDRYAVDANNVLLDKTSRLVYGAGDDEIYGTADDDNYYVYFLSMGDLGTYDRYNTGFGGDRVANGFTDTVANAIASFEADAAKLHKNRPLFIVSHMPLLDNRNDNGHAYDWCVAINKVAAQMDVAFFFGHNHNYDNASDYYYAKGTEMPVATMSGFVSYSYSNWSTNLAAQNVKLNFTHMCAGYMDPATTMYAGDSRQGTALVVAIYEDEIVYTTYDASGLYTGSNALEETVTRDWKDAPDNTTTPDGGDDDSDDVPAGSEPTVPSEPETPEDTTTPVEGGLKDEQTQVAVQAPGLEALTVVPVEKPEAVADLFEGDVVAIDITAGGFVNGSGIASVTLPIPEGVAAENFAVFHVDGDKLTKMPGEASADGKTYTFKTTHFSVYVGGQIANGATLSGTIDSEVGNLVGAKVYTLDTDGVTATNYLIATGDSGDVKLLTNNNNAAAETNAQVADSKITIADDSKVVWKYSNSSFVNNNRYIVPGNGSLSLSNNRTALTVEPSNNGQYKVWYSARSFMTKYYYTLRYNNGWTGKGQTGSAANDYVYLYEYTGNTEGAPVTFKLQQPAATLKTTDEPLGLTYEIVLGENETINSHDITWTSGDNAVATVDNKGVVTPKGNGETTIKAKLNSVNGNALTSAIEVEVKLNVTAVTVTSAVLTGESGTVYRYASEKSVVTPAVIKVTLSDNTSYDVHVTLDMLTDASGNAVSAQTIGTKEGLTVTYNGQILTKNFVLTVEEKPVNNHPSYPEPGSVNVSKTGTGIDFQDSGVAQIEISASGVPYSKGVDVIVMLDMSSSMTRCIAHDKKNCTDSSCITRVKELGNALEQLQTALQKSANAENIRVAIADFNGFYNTSTDPYYRDSNDDTADDNGLTSSGKHHQVYTGTGDLSAGAFIPATDLNVTSYETEFDPATGTNYDYAFDAIYQLGHSIKKANAAAGDQDRDLYVLFMSDGAPNQYNYYGSVGGDTPTSGSENWNYWLTGTADQFNGGLAALMDCNNHLYYYDETTGNQHRMANAIRGKTDTRYEVIRKSTTGLSDVLVATAENNMYTLPGLGATMYSIAFDIANDGAITKESVLHVLRNIPTGGPDSTEYYIEATEAGALAAAFAEIGGKIANAAENARFVDQLGSNYSIQLKTVGYGSHGSTTKDTFFDPYIEILGYEIYTKDDAIPDGKEIGDRKVDADGNVQYEVLEKVYFSEDGTKAYSNMVMDANGNPGWKEETIDGKKQIVRNDAANILNDGIICAKTFWYNTTASAVKIDGVAFPTQKNNDGTTGTSTTNLLPSETFYWKLGTLKETELAMRYYVYLDGSMEGNKDPGSYATNEFATLYYDNYLGNPCYKDTVSPILAWEAATVSYAFYLVNSAGQPVNMNGQVVPFSQRVTIVNPTKYAEVLLNSEAAFQDMQVISAEGFKLPAGYTLYDNTVMYHIMINSNGTGMWMIDWLYNAFLQVEDPESVFGGVSYQETTAENPPKAQTTYVTGHNINNASAYTNETFTVSSDSGYDYTHTTVWFAVVLEPKPIPDTVVIDYGLPVDVHVLVNDMFGDYGTLKGIAAGEVGQSTDEDAEDYMESSGKVTKGTVTKSTAQGTFGTAKMIVPVAGANEANSLIRYQVGAKFLYDENGNITGEEISNNLKMTEEEVFTYAVQYANPEAAYAHNNGIYYSTVTVIPATTIYYEDSFVTLKTYERSYVQVQAGDAFDSGTTYYTYDDSKKAYTKAKITEFAEGVTYYTLSDYKMTPGWEPVKEEGYTAGDITQAEDRPGEYNYGFHTTIDANNIYGYDGAYDNFSKYSLGQAAKVSVNDNKYGVATFSFYGTGFDVVSLTSNTSGVLIVDVYKGGQDKVYEEDGSIKSDAELVKSLIVDTYYGYDYGLYNVDYMLENGEWNRYIGMKAEDKEGEEPVDTSKAEEGVTKRTGVEYCWVPLPNKENALYQIPVMEVAGLEYGQYTADINAVYGKLFDHQKDGSYDLYLDAIRIYDPAGTTADELGEVIENAYKQDGEAYPVYQELRNNVIAASDFQYTDENDNVVPRINGITFLDGDLKTLSVADYVSYGPNNELYLAPGQAVTFGLDLDDYVDDTGKSIVDRVHLGIKSADGTDVSYALIDATGVQAKMDVASDDAYKAFVKKLTENNQEQIEAAENDAVAKLPEGATAEEIETAKQAAQASVLEPLIEEAYEDIVAAQLQAEKDAFDAAMKDSQKTVNSTTTDMYYDMTALKDKAIIIYNNGVSGILSLTNIKITFTEKPEGVSDLFYVDYETISKVLEGMKNVVSSGAESGNTEKSDEENQITLTYPEIVETGYEFTVQVTTTEETARVTVNGVEAQSDDKKHWSVKLTASEEGEMTVTAIAFNENSEETATVSAEVKIQVIEAKPVITVAAPAFVLVGSNYEITGTSVNTASITVGDTSVTPDDKGNWSVPLKASDTVCVEELVFTAVNNSGAKTTVTANVDTYAIDHPESANSEENIVVTITTTSNAAKVTADAKVITTYRTDSNGNRVWTTEFSKAAEAGEEGVVGEIAICVYNEEGYSSDAYTVSVNIIAPEEDNTQAVVETIRNIVSQIVNALFSWFGRS